MTNASDFDVAGKNPLPTATEFANAALDDLERKIGVPSLAITADELADIVAALFTLGTDPSFAGKPDGPRLINLAMKLTMPVLAARV